MVNETVQWMWLVLITLLVLGLLRRLGLMLPADTRAVHSGPDVGARLPKRAMVALEDALKGGSDRGAVVAFVTENCMGCQRLLARLDGPGKVASDPPTVLVTRDPTSRFREALEATGLPIVIDKRGELWETCRVTATPLVVRVDSRGRVVAKGVTHRVEQIARTASAEG